MRVDVTLECLEGVDARVYDTAGNATSGVASGQAGWNSTSTQIIFVLMNLPHPLHSYS